MNGSRPPTSADVRRQLVEALRLDLVGPSNDSQFADEQLRAWERPSNWYLTGFLVPASAPPEQRGDDDEEDDLGEIPDREGPVEESSEERKAAKKAFFPSSIGLSFLLPAETDAVDLQIRWGDYSRLDVEIGDSTESVWQRTTKEAPISVQLSGGVEAKSVPVPEGDGIEVYIATRAVPADGLEGGLPPGTRSVSVFLVNRRQPDSENPDTAYVFQPEVQVTSSHPFVARPDLRGLLADDWDEKVGDLHYADAAEFATGHGVSADWNLVDSECHVVRTVWIPSQEVERTETAAIPGVDLSMQTLGDLADGAAVRAALDGLVSEYRTWIGDRKAELTKLSGRRLATAEELLRRGELAATRIEHGIQVLAEDEDALDAFKVANRAVAAALRKRLGIEHPSWKAFQLAFILLNLSGLAEISNAERKIVDLLFFPTGGGKTEAYLGLSAFAIILRRLRNPGEDGKTGAGVAVVMRYTLRLLTLDQLSRAAGLICALELEREEAPERYGDWPIEIGLWVGKAATPNILGRKGDGRSDSARTKVRQFKADPKGKPSPIPIETCPWCDTRFTQDSFSLLPDDDHPRQLRVVCADFTCDFSGNRALPIAAVDDMIYRRLPAFLIATVDKFATLPWEGRSGSLLGGASRSDDEGFYGAAETGRGSKLSSPLLPPDLVIQDELHLISGPLGTMAGLYETAIEALASRDVNDQTIRPKIVASTATVRQAQSQIQALFGRAQTTVFPPPGPTRGWSFFAHSVPTSEEPGRLYLGIAAQGRNPKVAMRRVWLALMGAAERLYRENGGHQNKSNPVDPYMTVLGYFNSLRELGGARRILEEEVRNTVKAYGARKRFGEQQGLFQDRRTFSEVVELTSRVPTNKVAEARQRLGTSFDQKDRVDCAIATNMISVGLDISRLGLMVVLGQPKTTAEYIQATSRVGREGDKPGLVVTLLNNHKPRDRSHYERFRHYHETFYRSVEVGSVTPFSARALDRGFAGALVTLARHADPPMTPSLGAEQIVGERAELEELLRKVFMERVRQMPFGDAEREERLVSVQSRVVDLLDSWRKVYDDYAEADVDLRYQRYEGKDGKPLLRDMLDTDFESPHHKKFRVNRSLRDVEPEVNLFLRQLSGGS